MCTLRQNAKISVAYKKNVMNQIFKDFVTQTTIHSIDDIIINGCKVVNKKSSIDEADCRIFVRYPI